MKPNISIPSISFMVKVAIALAVIALILKFVPMGSNVKSYLGLS